jgi:signal transduction histidine kinase
VAMADLEAKVIRAIETLAVTEEDVQDDDGRWWALTIRPYQTIDARVDGAVLVFTDVDATKRYAERAEKDSEMRRLLLDASELARGQADDARQVAEAANSAKGMFLASMSHDLRTPLNAITGYTELLELGIRGPVTDAQLADFARIKRSARYLLGLINDILNFAKLQAGQIDYRITTVPLAALAAELHDLIAPQLAAKLLHFECALADAAVTADPEKVRQILLNLLSNALKFTESGGRMGIDSASSDDVVQIRVWDTGCGIAAEELPRIFEPFVQVNRPGTTTPSRDGVGLGLAISRDLARAMDGDLVVESAPGQGAQFTLTLPRASSI